MNRRAAEECRAKKCEDNESVSDAYARHRQGCRNMKIYCANILNTLVNMWIPFLTALDRRNISLLKQILSDNFQHKLFCGNHYHSQFLRKYIPILLPKISSRCQTPLQFGNSLRILLFRCSRAWKNSGKSKLLQGRHTYKKKDASG